MCTEGNDNKKSLCNQVACFSHRKRAPSKNVLSLKLFSNQLAIVFSELVSPITQTSIKFGKENLDKHFTKKKKSKWLCFLYQQKHINMVLNLPVLYYLCFIIYNIIYSLYIILYIHTYAILIMLFAFCTVYGTIQLLPNPGTVWPR